MSFEDAVIQTCDFLGAKNAEFSNGTLFFMADENADQLAESFRFIFPNILVSRVGDDMAIDFCGSLNA